MTDPGKKQENNEQEGSNESDISDPSDLFPGMLRNFIWKKIQYHSRPAGIPAPASAEQQRAENLRNRIMDRGCLEYTCEQIIPEALDLHILVADQSQIDKHVQPHEQLHNTPGVPVFFDEKEQPQRYGNADITEVEEIKKIVLCKPQDNSNQFKNKKHDKRYFVLLHLIYGAHLQTVMNVPS